MVQKKAQSPLLGYNTNVRHKGHLFHIQTEDSGIQYKHVITHLFTEGTILATKKTSYNELVDAVNDLEERVRLIMKDQHKAMFIELRDSIHDAVAERIIGAPLDDHVIPPAQAVQDDEPTPQDEPTPLRPAMEAEEDSGVRVIIPVGLKKAAEENDETVVESAASGERSVSETDETTIIDTKKKSRPQARSIFETPDENGEFGESLISDKSLDEVILSYLTEDDLE